MLHVENIQTALIEIGDFEM